MRFNGSAIATLICALLLLAALWFQPELPLVADSEVKPEQHNSDRSYRPVKPRSSSEQRETGPKTMVLEPFAASCRADVEARLDAPAPEITWDQLPLRDVLTELTKLSGITIYFDQEELGDVIDPDVPVEVHAVADTMSFRTLINRFVLEPNDLTFVVRDRFLVIMSYEKSLVASKEVVIYDCRDLITGVLRNPASVRDNSNFNQRYLPPGGMGPSGGTPITSELQLMQLIQFTIRNEDYPWDDGSYGYAGGDENVGTMEGMHGLLIVQTIPSMHERIQQLLDSLRFAIKKQYRSTTNYR